MVVHARCEQANTVAASHEKSEIKHVCLGIRASLGCWQSPRVQKNMYITLRPGCEFTYIGLYLPWAGNELSSPEARTPDKPAIGKISQVAPWHLTVLFVAGQGLVDVSWHRLMTYTGHGSFPRCGSPAAGALRRWRRHDRNVLVLCRRWAVLRLLHPSCTHPLHGHDLEELGDSELGGFLHHPGVPSIFLVERKRKIDQHSVACHKGRIHEMTTWHYMNDKSPVSIVGEWSSIRQPPRLSLVSWSLRL